MTSTCRLRPRTAPPQTASNSMTNPISPLDGRYADRTRDLARYFSEAALAGNRCLVELEYLLALDKTGLFSPFSNAETTAIVQLRNGWTEEDYRRVKRLESEVHDEVLACRLYLSERLNLRNPDLIHFGLCNEDIDNLAYGILLSCYKREVQIEQMKGLDSILKHYVEEWKDKPFPAHVQGRPAPPTTAGKEVAVFRVRLSRQLNQLFAQSLRGKLSGATGNYSALYAAFPGYDWQGFSRRFVRGFGLSFSLVTTQTEDRDSWCEYFDISRRINSIVMDLDVDFWLYASRGYFRPRDFGHGRVAHGPLVPTRFENSEGNLAISNALLVALTERLSRSRMQRDSSDNTVRRNIGVALGQSHLAIQQTLDGLRELDLDESRCQEDLDVRPVLLKEAVATTLIALGLNEEIDRLNEVAASSSFNYKKLHTFLHGLDIEPAIKHRLMGLRTRSYLGAAEAICDRVLCGQLGEE